MTFPEFNIYSTPLLVLVLQGLIFTVLLINRYFAKKNISDLLLALVLLITCYHRTTYTIGFMNWYDVYRNTKINYMLLPMDLAFPPLLYFYVKSVTTAGFKLLRKDIWHFVPAMVYIVFKLFIYAYDANQPGFADTQNGVLKVAIEFKYVNPLISIVEYGQMLIYLAFTIQLYWMYRKRIQQFFSNTYRLELNWIRNFLFIYSFLFLYMVFEGTIDAFIVELSWTQNWWYHFISALAILYIGVKGYLTDTSKLSALEFKNIDINQKEVSDDELPLLNEQKQKLENYMLREQPYLDPDLNLTELAKKLKMSRTHLSETINTGFQMNFNDFINSYRVNAVKEALKSGKQEELSLLGIAMECGFNSKATFNRVFKKLTGYSPTQFLTTQIN
ncbi:MAG: helix-turn-helix domain-containing protein [Bacteroidota bacterium]